MLILISILLSFWTMSVAIRSFLAISMLIGRFSKNIVTIFSIRKSQKYKFKILTIAWEVETEAS